VVGNIPVSKRRVAEDGNGAQPKAGLILRDTTLDQTKRGLIDNQRQFRLLVESVVDYAIYMLNPDGIISSWNPGAERIKGYSRDEVIGRSFERFFTEEDRVAGAPHRALETAKREGRAEAEGWRLRKDGSLFWASVVIDTIRDDQGRLLGFAKVTRDMTERRRHEEHLYRLAHYDPLTTLPNRLILSAALDDAVRSRRSVSVLMLDLDGFKEINDTLGHAAGDEVLKAAAQRIKDCVGDKGVVGRLGGDEFAIVVSGLADPIGAGALCEDLIEAFRTPIEWEDQESSLGLSIGIAMGPRHGASAPELLASADLALYRAKAEGRHSYSMFQPSFRQAAVARRTCDQELQQAVADGELELYYQPLVRLADRKIVGAEALLRWRHPRHGLLAPGAFLHVLDAGSLAATVGDWVIRTACTCAASMRRLGLADFAVSVNLFGAQFRKGDLVTCVREALRNSELPADALELEITENVILRHDEQMVAPLRELRALGVGIAFDDYGTGYASLSLLKRFPLSGLKIDQSFVRNVAVSEEDAAVVKAILYLARSFDLSVIAEGIETEQQASLLQDLGCQFGQGFLYAKPLPATQMLKFLSAQLDGSRQVTARAG
jgi:diguanylate cyclase (GGDEF)-like protein/PAS domain S-box-containing protein